MTATDTVMARPANNLRTRAFAKNMLRPATRRPAIRAITSVLVWVRSSMAPSATTATRVTPSRRLAAEPEHDHQPECDRREVRDLHRGDRPELPGEPALVECTAGRHQEAEEHRAEHDAERPQLAFDEQQVTPTRPGRQQPERGDELSEPDGPVQGTDDVAVWVDARDEGLDRGAGSAG